MRIIDLGITHIEVHSFGRDSQERNVGKVNVPGKTLVLRDERKRKSQVSV